MNLELNKIHLANCVNGLSLVEKKSIDTCISSPPYYALRDYGLEPTTWPAVEYTIFGFKIKVKSQSCCLGLENTPEEFIGHLVYIYRLVRETLKDDGTIWVNIGDSYSATAKIRTEEQAARKSKLKGSKDGQIACKNQQSKIFKDSKIKPKDMLGIPWMLAFALRDDGWFLRQDIIWHKLNCMPESVNDRCTKNHEYIFLLSKKKRYYFDQKAILQPVTSSTVARMNQNIEAQKGSDRAFAGGKHNGPMKSVQTNMPGGWSNSPFFKNDTILPDGRKPRPDDNIGGNQGKGTIPATSKIHLLDDDSYFPGQPRHKDSVSKRDDESFHSFRMENSKYSEPMFGQNAPIHRPDRKDTVNTGFANKRSVWSLPIFGLKEAHFATFPPNLIEDCIKAGSSQYGCCAVCGKPYKRMFTTVLTPTTKASYNTVADERDFNADANDAGSNRQKDGHKPGHVNIHTTTGWEKTCKHETDEIKPAVVMDMFMGSGTTAIVSSKLGRNFIGFEQSEKYLKIAERRLHKELGLFNPLHNELT